ncbi:hypothetical protein [Pontibacter roseus]|uniref:hypothetical protein n=1 Tax=Pontibacter roseus TaxID=336989 RepID=UPI0003696B9C|nr:hypothetical protein [Pontibacter roseus]
MRLILLTLAMLVTVAAHGQEQLRVVERYEKHVRTGSFLTRWYHGVRGNSTLWKESLILYGDQTYRYVYAGGECATFDTDEAGNWEKSGDFLWLSNQKRYLVKENKLYVPDTPIQEKAWVMKKRK